MFFFFRASLQHLQTCSRNVVAHEQTNLINLLLWQRHWTFSLCSDTLFGLLTFSHCEALLIFQLNYFSSLAVTLVIFSWSLMFWLILFLQSGFLIPTWFMNLNSVTSLYLLNVFIWTSIHHLPCYSTTARLLVPWLGNISSFKKNASMCNLIGNGTTLNLLCVHLDKPSHHLGR